MMESSTSLNCWGGIERKAGKQWAFTAWGGGEEEESIGGKRLASKRVGGAVNMTSKRAFEYKRDLMITRP